MRNFATASIIAFIATGPVLAVAQDSSTDAEKQAIQAIRNGGGQVLEIAQNDPRLDVAFHLSDQEITDAQLALLPPLAGKIVKLNLRGTKITDAGLQHLSPLVELERLHLEKTGITDAGLPHLKPLAKLTHLNLYGTQVSDAGLPHLAELKALQKLYLWQTQVTPDGVATLQTALPELEIIVGVDFGKPAGEPATEEKKEDPPAAEAKKE